MASTLGVLNSIARDYAHKIPFIMKINHNELLSCPNMFDQTLFASVEQAFDMGAAAVGATVYFGSEARVARSRKSARRFSMRMNLEWPRCCGPTAQQPVQERRG